MALNYNLVICLDHLTISSAPLMILFKIKVSFFPLGLEHVGSCKLQL